MTPEPPLTMDRFAAYLQDQFFDNNADLMILDDDMPDSFDNYISNVTPEEIYVKAQEYYRSKSEVLIKTIGYDFESYLNNPSKALANDFCKSQGID